MAQNQFKPVQQNRQQALRAYCPNICIYCALDTTWMEKWWIPINWACHHVKKEQMPGGHLPKEGKEVASALIKFNQNLEIVAEFKHNPLPALASQAHYIY